MDDLIGFKQGIVTEQKEMLLRKQGIDISWEPRHTESVELISEFSGPHEWQIEAYDMLKDAPHMILNAPMGSGKSWMMCLLSAYKLNNNPLLRCIIAVPQTIIASGFICAKLQLSSGERLIWDPSHNLCDDESNEGTVEYLIQWLENFQPAFNDRALICTHATLVAAHKRIINENRSDLYRNLLVWIDEAHHIKNSIVRGANGLGSLVDMLSDRVADNVQIGLTTATFFRGDRDSLISEKSEQLFKARYNLPYDKYLKSMKYLRSFSFDFLICGQDYMQAINHVVKSKKCKDIIYIPKPKSLHSKGCKYLEVKEIIDLYQANQKGQLVETADGLSIIDNGEISFKILDLVDEDSRNEKKKFLMNKTLQENKGQLDAIIALDMFKEGANWIWADRSIIVGPRGSLVDVIQMIGRLFRDAKDKHHVEIIQLLPFSLDQREEELQKNLNNYLKAIYSLLILEDILKPIKILIPKKERTENSKEHESSNKTKDLGEGKRLYELVPDENKRKTIVEETTKHLFNVYANPENQGLKLGAIYEAFQQGLPSVLDPEFVAEIGVIEAIGEHVWSSYLRKILKVQGIDVENIDFDIIQNTNSLDGLLWFLSGVCGAHTFEQLRIAFQNDWEKGFSILKQHFNESNSSVIPQYLVIDEVNLFNWATVQRRAYKEGKIAQDRIDKLESLPYWYWDYNVSRDDEGRMALAAFILRENHVRVPTTHRENEFPLGAWINTIKKTYANNELSEAEIQYFQSLVGWSWKDINNQNWDYGYSLLEKYTQIHKHAQAPSGTIFEGFALGTFVKSQREAYSEGELSDEKVRKLERLPKWSWDVFEDRNLQGFQALDLFVAREGHALVPNSYIEGEFPLGKWISSKRQAHVNPNSKNKITEEDRRNLESYRWWFWNGDEGRWERGKYYLLQFVVREEHSRVKLDYTEDDGYRGFKLGNWVSTWKQQYKKGVLSQEKIKFFESLPKWTWDLRETEWYEGYEYLKQYAEREGDALVPAKYMEGEYPLGTWVRTQLYAYKNDKLAADKVKLLEFLLGWVWKRS